MSTSNSAYEELFFELYNAEDEEKVYEVLEKYNAWLQWVPFGGRDTNYATVENQQSNPVAALVEKITNSIDAILMRKCYEQHIHPKSAEAPRSIKEAIERFFPEHKDWDLKEKRRLQAYSIQVLRQGKSLLIYDDGEGQRPEDFETTFLSLLQGNKNEIHFVHGRYNMGGSGAIVFCGNRRYQLLASKRYDGSGNFGFTLIRRHVMTKEEKVSRKSTWYEYFKIGNEIASFNVEELDLQLLGRTFRTGTITKLYSYELKGNSDVRRDLGRSVNEFLYAPALPIFMVQELEGSQDGYHSPYDEIFDLKNKLIKDKDRIEKVFYETYEDNDIGVVRVTVYVFKTMIDGKDGKSTRDFIRKEYFKNNMSVLFSVDGQVHGHYTSEFITRRLKFNILSDYVLIHVDCTEMNPEFRQELTMASRDRMKQGKESEQLRDLLAVRLRNGQLAKIYDQRRAAITVDNAEDDTILRDVAEHLPMSDELRQLLDQTFRLKGVTPKMKPQGASSEAARNNHQQHPFHPKRYPSLFKLDAKVQGDSYVLTMPVGGSKTLQFGTDVEDSYFSRSEDPGDLQIAVMAYRPNDRKGGNAKGSVNEITDIFNVVKRSPDEGTIRVGLTARNTLHVGDEVHVKVDLKNPAGKDFTELLWIKITEPPTEPKERVTHTPEPLGLPKLLRVYEAKPDQQEETSGDHLTWDMLAQQGIEMSHETVMYPLVEDDVLKAIYINMDSRAFKQYKSKKRNPSQDQLTLIHKRYVTAVYFHTIFLYVISKNKRYNIYQQTTDDSQERPVEIADYLKDIFSSHYGAFLMDFETNTLLERLDMSDA
jgi:hypothetical protein